MELYEPPQESVIEVSGEASLEELYTYNEKKEWRDLKPQEEEDTKISSKVERRVIDLKGKEKQESSKIPGSTDMHQDLKR